MNRRDALATLGGGIALGGAAPLAASERSDDHAPGAQGKMAPIANVHLHFCGIHVAKTNPKLQIVTQHYCATRSGGVHQCLLFDGQGDQARLLGVEYIVSDELFRGLPDDEKKYWHPHAYEVLAGGLIAPGMPAADEEGFMKFLLTTWGKTWHTWPDPASPVPTGEPLLMWSLTGDGQDDKAVIAKRDKEFGTVTADVRSRRAKQFGLDVPKVPPPASIETIGRQWTAEGEDKPTPLPK